MVNGNLVPVEEIVAKERERKLAFERVELFSGNTYKDCSTVIIVPTRGFIHCKVTEAWDNLAHPMNHRHFKVYAKGQEVGRAYTERVQWVLDHPILSKCKFVLTLEDDNLPPPDAHLKLLDSIELGPFDAISGLYWTKGDVNMPMAYGNPHKFKETGVLEFAPRDIIEALKDGNVMEVNGVGMGCTLWRMDVFRQLPPPWFVTVDKAIPATGLMRITQDLYFCERMRRAGMKLAVDLRVGVGHIDVEQEVVY